MRELKQPEEWEDALGEFEALLFAASRPLTVAQLSQRLYLTEEQGWQLLAIYRIRLKDPARGLQLRDAGGTWRLETKSQHQEIVSQERAAKREKPLTAQALEVLAVIALAQPITTEDISRTRGTESYSAIETLRKHGLVAAAESRGTPSRATYWRTTQRLLDRLGLKSLAELAQKGAKQTLLTDRDVARALTAQGASLPLNNEDGLE